MRIRSFVTGAALGVLAAAGAAAPQTSIAAMHVQSMGDASQDAKARFSVFLPLTHTADLNQLLQDQVTEGSARYHQWLTPAQFKAQFGPSRATFDRARALLEAANFKVVGEHSQSIDVEGPVWAVEKMFATRLENVRTPKGLIKLNAVNNRFTIPDSLAALGAVIPNFHAHLGMETHSNVRPLPKSLPANRLSNAFSFYYANDMAEAYVAPSFQTRAVPKGGNRPVQIAGVGSKIGIVISSRVLKSDFLKSFNSTISTSSGDTDVQAYSTNSNLPVPTFSYRDIDGGAPNPPILQSSDFNEASLDTQMSMGTAPGASEIVYDMPELADDAIIDAYTAVDEDNVVDVVSSSFGECELDFTAAYNGGVDFTGILKTFHSLFVQGNAQGITFFASSGDEGSPMCLSATFVNNPQDGTNFVAGVSSPAEDPNVTGVGGTNLQTSPTPGDNDAAYLSENADFDPRVPAQFQVGNQVFSVGNHTWGSGGGISQLFAKPGYQFLVKTGSSNRRTVPDVSLMMGGCPGDADLAAQDCTQLPRSAAIVWLGGNPGLLIGTSSGSPQMAGVTALAVELNGGRLGNINPMIYQMAAKQTRLGGVNAPAAFQYFHRNISGNNNGFAVKPGDEYSEVLGTGTLNIKTFLGLQKAAPAGTPSTFSNP